MAYSIQRVTSDGTLVALDLTIKYISRTDMFVYVGSVLQAQDGSTPYTWSWINDTRIGITPAVPLGEELAVRRVTFKDEPLHIFNAGAVFSETSMDENFLQDIYIAQENSEASAVFDLFNDVDMHQYRIRNAGDGILPKDYVTKQQLDFATSQPLKNGTRTTETYTATAGQTVVTTVYEYLPNLNTVAVVLNGLTLVPVLDYTETSGNTITLLNPMEAGDVVVVEFFGSTLNAVDAVNVGFIQAGAGAVPRTGQDKMRESVSVKDFGAVGDGVADDTAAIQAALDASKNVLFPAGTYKISASLIFKNNHYIHGDSKGGLAGISRIIVNGAIAAFKSGTQGVTAVSHVVLENLTINNAAIGLGGGGVGSLGVDLTDVSFSTIRQCSFRYHDINIKLGGTVAGYYNSILETEISSANTGIYFASAGNSNKVFGGRVHSNTVGIYGVTCTDNYISTSIESNETGIYLDAGTTGWFMQCRYEGNGQTISGDVPINTALGAAVLLKAGSARHQVFGICSNGADRIIDQGTSNQIYTSTTGYGGVVSYGGENNFLNSSMSFDSNADGFADGMSLSTSTPVGTTMSVDTVDFKTGTGSQLMAISAAGSSRRDLRVQKFSATVGVTYTLACRVKTNLAAGWSLRVGTSFATSEYANAPLSLVGEWSVMSVTFVATTPDVCAYFYTAAGTVAPSAQDNKLWIDSIYFGAGSKAPEFGMAMPRSNFVTYDPPSIAAGASVITTIPMAGVVLGDYVSGVSFSLDTQGITLSAQVSAANVVSVTLKNETAAPIDLASGTLTAIVKRLV